MARDLIDFTGEGLIVGGGWCDMHQYTKPAVRNPANFYTIDIDKKAMPDACIDITDEKQCLIFPKERFSLIYFEFFPLFSINEKKLEEIFKAVQRFLKKDGILIYHGCGTKFVTSIPDIMKKAGYLHTFKKKLNPAIPKYQFDNGGLSLATNIDLKLLKEKFSDLPEVMQYYLNYYNFFSDQAFYPQRQDLPKKKNVVVIPNKVCDFSTYRKFLKLIDDNVRNSQNKVYNVCSVMGSEIPDATHAITYAELRLFPITKTQLNNQENNYCGFKPGFLIGKRF